MTAPKAKKKAGGRPTKLKPEFIEQAYNYALLGATNGDLAEFFEVDPSTIDNWLKNNAEFLGAVKRGKEIADSKVAQSLYNRANGYEFTEKKTTKRKVGEVTTMEQAETVKHVAADTTACIFWLKNRQPDQWREKKVVEFEGEGIKVIEPEYVDP